MYLVLHNMYNKFHYLGNSFSLEFVLYKIYTLKSKVRTEFPQIHLNQMTKLYGLVAVNRIVTNR